MPILMLALLLHTGELLNITIADGDMAFECAQLECLSVGFSNIKYAELSFMDTGTTWLTEDELLHPYPY